MGLWDHLLDRGGGFDGVKLPAGKYEGTWRPGRRSEEIALRGAGVIRPPQVTAPKPSTDQAPPPTGQRPMTAPVGMPARPQGVPVGARPLPSRVPVRPIRPVSGSVRPVSGRRPAPGPARAAAPARLTSALAGLAGLLLDGRTLDGMGDAGVDAIPDAQYTPNGEVWVSDRAVPLFWRCMADWQWEAVEHAVGRRYAMSFTVDPANRRGDFFLPVTAIPVLYPDGTQVYGRIWLPKRNVGAELGWPLKSGLPEAFPWPPPPGPDGVGRIISGRTLAEGGNASSVQFYPGYRDRNAKLIAPETWQVYEFPVSTTRTASRYFSRIDFDWSTKDPTAQAYPWLYDHFAAAGYDENGQVVVVDDAWLTWTAYPADFWRGDGASVEFALPEKLPPKPLLCVEFLISLLTGEHGMPRVLKDDGTVDRQVLQSLAQLPLWTAPVLGSRGDRLEATTVGQALAEKFQQFPNSWTAQLGRKPWTDWYASWGTSGDVMLATVYDVKGPVTGFVPLPEPEPQEPIVVVEEPYYPPTSEDDSSAPAPVQYEQPPPPGEVVVNPGYTPGTDPYAASSGDRYYQTEEELYYDDEGGADEGEGGEAYLVEEGAPVEPSEPDWEAYWLELLAWAEGNEAIATAAFLEAWAAFYGLSLEELQEAAAG